MKLHQTLLLLPLATSALAAPSSTLEKRATTICGQWDSVVTGTYTVYQDLWGESATISGSQCTTVNSDNDGTLSWSTSWTWAGGSSSVKSYTGNSIVADVSYDMFTSSSATGSDEYEIMIWLTALGGAGPISSTGSPIATPTIDGLCGLEPSLELLRRPAELLKVLGEQRWFPSSQYLLSIGAGTEPFTGSDAVLTVSAYNTVVN